MALLISVTDPRDPRIEVFRDIRERDIVGRRGFIAEGTVVLDVLLSSASFRPTALLILKNRLNGLADHLDRLPDDVPVYVAEREVIDAIAGFPIHRGVLAHGEAVAEAPGRPDALLDRLAGEGAVVVALVGLANHDNMGAVFRNAAAFGAGAVLIDETCCDPFYRKAIRVSVGQVFRVPLLRFGPAEAMMDALTQTGFRRLALSPAGRIAADRLHRAGPTALVLGTEGRGLPDRIMTTVETVRIDIAPGVDSLNVATTSAIVLHRLYRPASDQR
ncbi:TrmH family RNA methyltransferase [Consotaella aegiceratis]|uniref:TrmH family RNA methyltransferase n=1 Tax=Consotaella aegiceratis TaxID=3097961 RepID=UPI002F407C2B